MSTVPDTRKEDGKFIVVREYSHTDRRKLYKVLSRPMEDERAAVSWMNFMADMDEPSPGDKFMVVKVVAEVIGDKVKHTNKNG